VSECARIGHRRLTSRFGFLLVMGLSAIPARAGQSQAVPAPNYTKTQRACACADGRQFSVGASLFGKNSARIVISGFHADPVPIPSATQLPICHDLTVVGQVVRLKTTGDRPFFQRESLKRGTIRNICQTKIQFLEPKKSYDFFADDGSAVTLSDGETGQGTPAGEQDTASAGEEQASEISPDLTGKDLIPLISRERQGDDPAASTFDADDLKAGAYCIVRRHLKAFPAIDDNSTNTTPAGSASPQRGPATIWAGTLGRVEKRAGFRSEPLWVVELLPHSAPLPFSRPLGLLFEALHKNRPFTKKVALPSSDIVEINHFFDQYGIEWTRFGVDAESDDISAREALGTTVLPDLYDPPAFTLEENLRNAQKIRAFEAVQATALQLVFIPKESKDFDSREMLILNGGSRSESTTQAAPDLFRQQCFLKVSNGAMPQREPRLAEATILRVSDVDIRVFQPSNSAQVPDEYYAIDLKLQLRSGSGDSHFPIVCRFPLAAIDVNLVGQAERILSSRFEIRKRGEK
jgi:hypothetical protein